MTSALAFADPAVAAPCNGLNCYQYVPDISVTGWSNTLGPVLPGSIHSFTGVVTNSGVRLGGPYGPTPWPGPASGVVYFGFLPGSTDDVPQSCHVDIGPPLGCFGGYHGLAYDLGSMPTNTSYQMTVYFQAPQTPGWYTFNIVAYPFPGPQPWYEYNPDNDKITINYEVAYWA
jgi:hypothetical protein